MPIDGPAISELLSLSKCMQAPFIFFSGMYHSGELSCLAGQLNELACSLKRELAVILISFPGKCRKCDQVFPTLFTTKNVCLECALHICIYSKFDCGYNALRDGHLWHASNY